MKTWFKSGVRGNEDKINITKLIKTKGKIGANLERNTFSFQFFNNKLLDFQSNHSLLETLYYWF